MGYVIMVLLFAANVLIEPRAEPEMVISLERLLPIKEDRQLDTGNCDLLFSTKSCQSINLKMYLGLTASRAIGDITQLTGSLEAGTLKQETFASSATGLGPATLARIDVLRGKRISAVVDVEVGIVFYDRDFPAGGSRYNGMFRGGPALTYKIGSHHSVSGGYRWMHVSNGKGLGPDNPAYDGAGANLQYCHSF